MTAEQIASASTALTGSVNAVVSTFVELLPIIALTTGAVFAIKFVMGRFREIKNVKAGR